PSPPSPASGAGSVCDFTEDNSMSRWAYLLGVGLVLVALAFVLTEAALGPRLGITQANAQRIRKGMTSGEVEGILGGPPQEGSSWRGMRVIFNGTVVRRPDGGWGVWEGPAGKAEVHFDEHERVARCVFWPTADRPAPPSTAS